MLDKEDAKKVLKKLDGVYAFGYYRNDKVIVAREDLDLMYWSDKRMTRLTEKIYQGARF